MERVCVEKWMAEGVDIDKDAEAIYGLFVDIIAGREWL